MGEGCFPKILTCIMLQKFVHPNVPHFYRAVGTGCGDTSSTWVEFNVVHKAESKKSIFPLTATVHSINESMVSLV